MAGEGGGKQVALVHNEGVTIALTHLHLLCQHLAVPGPLVELLRQLCGVGLLSTPLVHLHQLPQSGVHLVRVGSEEVGGDLGQQFGDLGLRLPGGGVLLGGVGVEVGQVRGLGGGVLQNAGQGEGVGQGHGLAPGVGGIWGAGGGPGQQLGVPLLLWLLLLSPLAR